MALIEYYFAAASPFVYLAGTRLEKIAAQHGAKIDYRPCDIGALYARTGGVRLFDRHRSRREYHDQDLRRQAIKLGLKINLKPLYWPINTAPSAYAIITAQRIGGGNLGLLVQNLATACWRDEQDISQDDVIRDCLAQAGFDPGLADKGMLASADTYAANLEAADIAGVFGAPFYIIGGERFWGQDRLDDLDLFLAGKLH